MRLLQPSSNLQLSKKNPDRFLKRGLEIVRKGWGQPSIFNADMVVEELLRQGKSIEDARMGGTSGCVETGAFGKEAYILTGYFNLPKVLEIALNNGVDPRTGKRIGLETGDPRAVRDLRRSVRRLPPPAAPLHRHQDARQQRDRAAVRASTCPRRSCRCWSTTASPRAGTTTTAARATTPPTSWASRRARCTDSLSAIRHHVFDRKDSADGATARRAGGELRRAREDAAAAVEPHAEVRQRRRLRGRHPGGCVRRVLRRDERAEEHQGRQLPRELSVHDLPRLFRFGDRRDARRPQGLGAALRRHLAGRRAPTATGRRR